MDLGTSKDMLDELTVLNRYVDAEVSRRLGLLKEKTESDQLDKLSTALSKAQGMFKSVKVNRKGILINSRYADLDALVRATREGLSINQLSVINKILTDDSNGVTVITRLTHSSGQFMTSTSRIVGKSTHQEYAEALRGLRRENLKALLNITETEDPLDNDCELETRENFTDGLRAGFVKEKNYETITEEQVYELQQLLKGRPDIGKELLKSLRIKHLSEIPASKFTEFRDYVVRWLELPKEK